MTTMNPFQKLAARTYERGAFAYLIDLPNWYDHLPPLNDTLFAFVMVELSFSEGCNDTIEAAHRMMSAAKKLMSIVDALNKTGKQ